MKKIIGIFFTVMLLFASIGPASAAWVYIDETDRRVGNFSCTPSDVWVKGESWTPSYYGTHSYTPAFEGRHCGWSVKTTAPTNNILSLQVHLNHPNFKAQVNYTLLNQAYFPPDGEPPDGSFLHTMYIGTLNQDYAVGGFNVVPTPYGNTIGWGTIYSNGDHYFYGIQMNPSYHQPGLLMGADMIAMDIY